MRLDWNKIFNGEQPAHSRSIDDALARLVTFRSLCDTSADPIEAVSGLTTKDLDTLIAALQIALLPLSKPNSFDGNH
jgi:hypothetical protein